MAGGGIFCSENSSPNITGNAISDNRGYFGGGICCEYNSNPIISSNTIKSNSAGTGGGGICCFNSSPSISGNNICGNWAVHWPVGGSGGGIYCDRSNPAISDNTISGNGTLYSGGGISCHDSNPIISGNTISGNSASNFNAGGGGISCGDSNPTISGNTTIGNLAGSQGGGIVCNSNPMLINCILWGNVPDQIHVPYGSPQVTYSDIQGGYPGTGNINTWPAFVDTAQDDYRLQWGSPCIDSGDPNPIYNDPDGTRSDMGAWFYDQFLPVRILLTPYNQPIQIPASGGSFQYAIQATNIESSTLSPQIWCNVTLPSGTIYGPVLGPVTISLGSGQTLSRVRTQAVPAGAPAGMYHYNAFAVAAGDTSQDNFVFTKLAFGDWGLGSSNWDNTGEDFTTPALMQAAPPKPVD